MVDNNEIIKTQLQYKQHGDFFEDYFLIRKKAFSLLAQSISEPKLIRELYETLLTLIDYTSNYIDDIEALDEKLITLNKVVLESKKNSNKNTEVIKQVRDILRTINIKHEQSEILPQKSQNFDKNESFWRDEESRAMKEMKKAFYDVFMKK